MSEEKPYLYLVYRAPTVAVDGKEIRGAVTHLTPSKREAEMFVESKHSTGFLELDATDFEFLRFTLKDYDGYIFQVKGG